MLVPLARAARFIEVLEELAHIRFQFSRIATLVLDGRRTIAIALGVSAALAALGPVLGASPHWLNTSSELVLGFSQLVFVAAFGRSALPDRRTKVNAHRIATQARNLTAAFVATFTAFLLIVPMQSIAAFEVMPLSTMVYLVANALIVGVLIAAAHGRHPGHADDRIARTFHALALAYFWCFFVAFDCTHIGRSRWTDPFFIVALALLVAALVLRLAAVQFARRTLAEKVG